MRVWISIAAALLIALAAAGCDRSRNLGPLSPRLPAASGEARAGDVPTGQISPVYAADAPIARTRDSAPPPPPAAPASLPGRETKYEARLDGVKLPVAAERPPVMAPSDDGAPRLVDTVLAEVNDEVITREDILGPLRPQMEQWRREFSADAFESRCRQVVDMKLREAISHRLVVQAAKTNLTDEQKKEVEAVLGQNVKDMASEAGSTHSLEVKMKSQGSTIEAEKNRQRERMLIQRYLREKIAPAVHVTHGELLGYYDKVKAERYQRPMQVRLALIMIKKSESATPEQARTLALAVYERARSGEDFGRLAQRYSHDPMAGKGGDWGNVTQGSFRVMAVDDALFRLAAGEIGPFIETNDAFYVVKAAERHEARTVPFTEVQNDLEDELKDKKFNDLVSKYIQQLYEQSYVRVMMENL